jgi:hypothetical protein
MWRRASAQARGPVRRATPVGLISIGVAFLLIGGLEAITGKRWSDVPKETQWIHVICAATTILGLTLAVVYLIAR